MFKKQSIVYGSLAALIFIFLYLLVSASYQPPDELVNAKDYKDRLSPETETDYRPNIAQPKLDPPTSFPGYGKKDIFTTIMATPSPQPTRTPRPTPTPSLERVLKNYDISGVVGNKVFLLNKRKKTDVMLTVGEKMKEEDRKIEMDIELIDVDPAKFTATFKYKDQEATIKLEF
jgi:hypothetical protein